MYPLTFSFYTNDLAKTWDFYSAIGIEWNLGSRQQPNSIPLPEEFVDFIEPDLMGSLSGTQIWFFYKEDVERESNCTIFQIEYDHYDTLNIAVKKLVELELFAPEENFTKAGGLVKDPEGRRIHLRQPDLHRMAERKFKEHNG